MKRTTLYTACLICLGVAFCKSPMPITFNPDDHTNANGTAGSAKMTYQMPTKNNNVPIKNDSIKMPVDTTWMKQ